MVIAIEVCLPLLVKARDVAATFQATLETWLERAQLRLLAVFANGVFKEGSGHRRDYLTLVERSDRRQLTKLKLIKRQIWTREARSVQTRVIGPA